MGKRRLSAALAAAVQTGPTTSWGGHSPMVTTDDHEREAGLPSLRSCLLGAFGDLRRSFSACLTYEILLVAGYLLIVSPLVSFAYVSLMALYGSPVLTNEQILAYMISAPGLMSIAFGGVLFFCSLHAESAGLLVMVHRIDSGLEARPLDALVTALRRLPSLLLIGMRHFLVLALAALPAVALGFAVHALLLSAHDIGYYLARKPPQFWLAACALGLLLLAYALTAVALLTRWVFAVPSRMFEATGVGASLARSRALVRGSFRGTAFGLVACAGILAAAVAAVLLAVGLPMALALSGSGQRLLLLLLLTGAAVAVANLSRILAVPVMSFFVYRLYIRERLRSGEPLAPASMVGSGPAVQGTPAKRRHMVATALIFGALIAAVIGEGLHMMLVVPEGVQIVAHRGSSMKAPENTLSAIRQAVEDGADFVEIDVRETADGVIVVCHDSDLMRTAGDPRKVWDMSYDDLSRIDVGSWFSPRFSGERVPTLAMAIGEVRDRAALCVELKMDGHNEALVQRTIDVVRAEGLEQDSMVISLDYEALGQVRDLAPSLGTGLLIAKGIGDVTRLDVDVLLLEAAACTPAVVAEARAAGKEVGVWTVNDEREMERFVDMGVRYIITDRPDVLARAINGYLRMSGETKLVRRLEAWLEMHL